MLLIDSLVGIDLIFFVRELVLVCLRHNVHFKAKHILGLHTNKLIRCLGCNCRHSGSWHQLHMHPFPTEIPHHLQPIGINWHR